MRKSVVLLGASLMAATLLGAAARAEEPSAATDAAPAPEASTDPDIAFDEAQPQHRGSRWLTDEEEARLRVAGEQTRLAAQSAGERLKVQGAALKAAIDQLKPTPEQMAQINAMIDQEKALLREQTEAGLQR